MFAHCLNKQFLYRLFITLIVTFSFPNICVADLELDPAFNAPLKAQVKYLGNKYLVGPGDILSLDVLHESEYKQDSILVRPDGNATFIGVGEFNVSNQTVESITQQLKMEISKTLIDPKIMLTVKTTRPGTVYLTGAFMHPGMFQFTTDANDKNLMIQGKETVIRTDMRLSNVFANAGGLKLNADLSDVVITRASSSEMVHVNLWKILKEGSSQDDVWINYGDRIHVPEGSMNAMSDEDFILLLSSGIGPKNFPIRVIGEVKTPGIYYLESPSPYLNSAVSQAGGFAPQANRKVVAIRRFTDENHFSTLYTDLKKSDFVLRPNDVVFISENKVYLAGRFMQQATYMLTPFQTAALTGGASAQTYGFGGWARRF